MNKEPKLINRRENRKSNFQMGRTIGEKREKLETANERAAARKKDKKKKTFRAAITIVGFLVLGIMLVLLAQTFIGRQGETKSDSGAIEEIHEPSIEILDEGAPTEQISNRIRNYIGQAERDFRDLGYTPTRAVIPAGAIREVDFYLEGRPGYIKTIIDRGTAVSVEDADRMMRYLEENGIGDYSYIDVRIDGKAYWK